MNPSDHSRRPPAHNPDDVWRCRTCSAEWPCPATRDRLHAELGATPVAIEQLMSAYLLDALASRPDLHPRDLADRHLGWVRERYPSSGRR